MDGSGPLIIPPDLTMERRSTNRILHDRAARSLCATELTNDLWRQCGSEMMNQGRTAFAYRRHPSDLAGIPTHSTRPQNWLGRCREYRTLARVGREYRRGIERGSASTTFIEPARTSINCFGRPRFRGCFE